MGLVKYEITLPTIFHYNQLITGHGCCGYVLNASEIHNFWPLVENTKSAAAFVENYSVNFHKLMAFLHEFCYILFNALQFHLQEVLFENNNGRKTMNLNLDLELYTLKHIINSNTF